MSSTSGVLSPRSSTDQPISTQEAKAKVMSSEHEWPRLCMVTGSPPGRHGVGQVYMRDLAKRFSSGSVCTVAVLDKNANWESEVCENLEIEFQKVERRYETSWKPVAGFVGETLARIAWRFKTEPQVKACTEHVEEFARQQKSEAYLVVLESPFLISVAARLAREGNRPVYSLIWDHPEHVMRSFGHTGTQLRSLVQQAEAVIQASTNVLVVGEHLKEWVYSSIGKESIVLRHATENRVITESRAPSTDDVFKIGFAGSVTAPDGFELLQTTLDQMNWMVGTQKVELHLFGFRYVLESEKPRNIVYHGFMHDTEDVIRELSLCDATFLPQSFSSREELVTRFSFPTKLSTYLAAGRPTFALTPEFSEISAFMTRYQVGPLCQVLNSSALQGSLKALLSDTVSQVKWGEERIRAMDEQFSIAANVTALDQLFSISTS